jgi:hypothetical protein
MGCIVPTMKRRRGRNGLDARQHITACAAYLLRPWLGADIPAARRTPERRIICANRAWIVDHAPFAHKPVAVLNPAYQSFHADPDAISTVPRFADAIAATLRALVAHVERTGRVGFAGK